MGTLLLRFTAQIGRRDGARHTRIVCE
jgi:hypothetical protein